MRREERIQKLLYIHVRKRWKGWTKKEKIRKKRASGRWLCREKEVKSEGPRRRWSKPPLNRYYHRQRHNSTWSSFQLKSSLRSFTEAKLHPKVESYCRIIINFFFSILPHEISTNVYFWTIGSSVHIKKKGNSIFFHHTPISFSNEKKVFQMKDKKKFF